MQQQLPLMQGHAGGETEQVERWDARATYDVGLLITRYLHQCPAPAGSSVASRLDVIGRDLQGFGKMHLEQLGLRHLDLC